MWAENSQHWGLWHILVCVFRFPTFGRNENILGVAVCGSRPTDYPSPTPLNSLKKKQGDALCADRAGAFLGKGFNALCQTLGLGKGPRSGWKVYISMLLSLSMVHIGLSVYLVWHWILGFKFLRHAQLSQLCFNIGANFSCMLMWEMDRIPCYQLPPCMQRAGPHVRSWT